MSLFRKNRRGQPADVGELPDDLAARMERLGRHAIDPARSKEDPSDVFSATEAPLVAAALADPDGFVATLADACAPLGGWAAYGAQHCVVDLLATAPSGPQWWRLLDASIEFLRANHVPPMRVPGYLWDRFIDTGGSANTWLELRPPPARDTVTIRPPAEGEVRRLVTLGPEPDANVVLLTRRDGEYVALIDSKWSDEDPTRSQSEWKRNADLYDLYIDVAWACQVWDWADPDIEPFFPAPRARI